ncbi:PQQ-binding-like beta-propeller repeat protein [Flaviaesturariibacter amylovorans]|uniref:Pyrrolo-quinoline quinone repeat domain-containing protein n=1 Tax=Flaviaesturariibacter amylovorans TaxID=1084520 RepID=A0ABP8HBS7_9BACT
MLRSLLSLCLLLVLGSASAADGLGTPPEKQLWKKKFAGAVKWFRSTDAGMVVVCTADALYGIDPATGEEKWKNEGLRNIQEDNYDPIEASPMIAIVDRGINPAHIVIDVFTGKVIIDSKEAGLAAVQKRFADPDLQGLFFYGTNKRGKPMMLLADAASGTKRWEAEKIFDKATEQIVAAPYAVSKDAFMIATTKGVYKISLATGDVLWETKMKNEAVELKVAKGGFNMFKSMNKTANANATATNARFFALQQQPDLVYFYSNDQFTAFQIADGKEAWERVKLKSPVTDVLYDSHGLLLATAENDDDEKQGKGMFGKLVKAATDKNKARLMCLDYRSGKELWKDHIGIAGDVVYYKYADVNTLILATANEKGRNRIDVIDLNAGKSNLKNPFKVDGDILDIRMVPQGLLYRTTDELNILDLNTYKDAWSKSLKFKTGSMGVDKDNDTYIYGDGKVYRFDNAKGDYEQLCSGLDFSGGERPAKAELRANGILFSAEQNMVLVDFTGKKLYQVYKRAPGKSAASLVFLSAIATVSTMAMARESFTSGYARGKGATSAAEYHERQASNWGDLATASFKEMGKRFKATADAQEFLSVLTRTSDSDESGIGIVLLRKDNGQEEGAIVLRDKKPEYQLDGATHRVFYKSGSDELTAYSF